MKPADLFEEILDLYLCEAIADPERRGQIQDLIQARKAQLEASVKCTDGDITEGVKRRYAEHANKLIDRILAEHHGSTDKSDTIE